MKRFKFLSGGRTSNQTFMNAIKLLKYIDTLEPNKMYGISKIGKGMIILTKNNVISETKIIDRIKEKIEPVINNLERDGFVGYADELRDILEELLVMEDSKDAK